MSDTAAAAASSSSSNSPSAVVPHVSYKLTGTYKINTPIYLKDVSDINRRSAIVMASHLFHTTPYSNWKKFRGNVAAGIYKHMSSAMYAMNVRCEGIQPSSIPGWDLVLDSNSYIVDKEKSNDWPPADHRTFTSTVGACFEMIVANRFIVVVTYAVEINCEFGSELNDLEGFKIVPEPHLSWAELIEDVDKAHEDAGRQLFSATLADNAVSMSPKYRPLLYVQYKDKFTRHIFSFN